MFNLFSINELSINSFSSINEYIKSSSDVSGISPFKIAKEWAIKSSSSWLSDSKEYFNKSSFALYSSLSSLITSLISSLITSFLASISVALINISSWNKSEKSTTFCAASIGSSLKKCAKSKASSSASVAAFKAVSTISKSVPADGFEAVSTISKSDLSASKSVFTEGAVPLSREDENSETMLSIKKFKSSSLSMLWLSASCDV